MKKLFLILLLLGGCADDDKPANRQAQADGTPAAPASPAGGGAAPALTTLVGLYEGGDRNRPHRMCVVDEGGENRFGLVIWGANDHSCSGAGTVTREGGTLRLAMTGDSACTIAATISGRTVTLPTRLPAGCSYYCGARAAMTGASLSQTGTTEAEAGKAQDLVGEPLCG